MAEQEKAAEQPPAEEQQTQPARAARRSARPAAKEPEPRHLTPAGEATDPAVHQVLAGLQTARANGDDGEVERLTAQLAELGYE